MTVGERIKLRREELGLTQDELAKNMGYSSRQSVSKAENYGDNITTAKIEKYANALEVSFDWLMGWEESIPQMPSNIEDSIEEKDLIKSWRTLDDEFKKQLLLMIKFFQEQNQKEN